MHLLTMSVVLVEKIIQLAFYNKSANNPNNPAIVLYLAQ
jgi:hypothetical protein